MPDWYQIRSTKMVYCVIAKKVEDDVEMVLIRYRNEVKPAGWAKLSDLRAIADRLGESELKKLGMKH